MDAGSDPIVGILLGSTALVVQLLVLAVGAAWAVSKIRSTTTSLGREIHDLGHSIAQLRNAIEKLDARVYEHAGRIATLEARDEQS
jgi:hypothetical protein